MSDDNGDDATAPADAIPDFGALYPREVKFGQFNVLSLTGDQPTAYHADIQDLTCSCPDEEFNREGDEVCKHLAAALFQAREQRDFGDMTRESILEVHKQARDALQDMQALRDLSTTRDASRTAESVSQETETESETVGDSVDNLVGAVGDWLAENDVETEHLEVAEASHDGTGGIAIHPDNSEMPDKEYEWFKSVVQEDVEDPGWHLGFADGGCPNCGEENDEFYVMIPAGDVHSVVS